MHPEWLTSTVTAWAWCAAEPSSHSTSNFTLEMMRLWLRSCAQRSCKDLATMFGARFGAMCDLTQEVCGPGEGGSKLTASGYPVQEYFFTFSALARECQIRAL